ncbi:MAG: M3 family oligoendopeptidase [Chloroflexota bacterium]|nr:MAG: M3 family oligoendopeptidase [Chloroflexota bacterium]
MATDQILDLRWHDVEPRFRDLAARPPTETSIDDWLSEWSSLTARLDEASRRLEVATTRDTADTDSRHRYHAFLDEIYPPWQQEEQRLKSTLLGTGIEPRGLEVQLRKMRTDAALYRESNVVLLSQEIKLAERYASIAGTWSARWDAQDRPLAKVRPFLQDVDRTQRERAWRVLQIPVLRTRDEIEALWREVLQIRERLAANAGLPDYRAFRWQELKRFDYTPADCKRFNQAILELVVPVVDRMYQQRRRDLGIEALRPWDLDVDPRGLAPLRPFAMIDELLSKTSSVFHHVDPQLGGYFDTMRREDLLDLDSRLNKAQGGYCLPFNLARRPFIFLSLVGTQGDIVALLHEGGHAFHVFEMAHLPYVQQRDVEKIGAEFAEVASTAMELLASPHLSEHSGGYYSERDASRHIVETLEGYLTGWCWIALVDAFQHWVYEHPDLAADVRLCADRYLALYTQYFPSVDCSGLEPEVAAGWLATSHIYQTPFYYIEYGLAQLGAIQIWANALRDQASAAARYRHALSLGDTRSIPDLFAAAGGKLGFDRATLKPAVKVVTERMAALSNR